MFAGSGIVSTPKNLTVDQMNPVYIGVKAPAGSYVLKTVDNTAGFYPVTAGNEPLIPSFHFYLSEKSGYSTAVLPLEFAALNTDQHAFMGPGSYRLYPNPSSDAVFIENLGSDLHYKIFNPEGRLMNSRVLEKGNKKISIESLPSGVYFLKAASGDVKINSKFIKK